MHRVCAEHNEVSTSALNSLSCVNHQFRSVAPTTLVLQSLDLIEVNGVQQALCRTLPTESFPDCFIDDAVVLGRRLPTHTADQTDGLHICRDFSGGVTTVSIVRRGTLALGLWPSS